MRFGFAAFCAASVLALAPAAMAAAPGPVPTAKTGPGSLSGIWIGAGIRNEPAPGDTIGQGARTAGAAPAPAAASRVDPGQGARTAGSGALPRDPPLKAQYLPDWRKRQIEAREREARGEPPYPEWVGCLPTGMPSMMSAIFPMEIIETPTQITIIAELFNQTRRIYLNQPQAAVEDTPPSYGGRSVGRWEGDTLVVDTIAVKEEVRSRDVPHSPNMRITERIRVNEQGILENQITITDPEYLTEPMVSTVRLRREPNYEMQEYVCDNIRVYVDPKTGLQRLQTSGK